MTKCSGAMRFTWGCVDIGTNHCPIIWMEEALVSIFYRRNRDLPCSGGQDQPTLSSPQRASSFSDDRVRFTITVDFNGADYIRVLHVMPRIVLEIHRPRRSIHERWRPHREPVTEFVSSVLGVGDPAADFLVVLPPGCFLTFFGLVIQGVCWIARDGGRDVYSRSR